MVIVTYASTFVVGYHTLVHVTGARAGISTSAPGCKALLKYSTTSPTVTVPAGNMSSVALPRLLTSSAVCPTLGSLYGVPPGMVMSTVKMSVDKGKEV